MYLNCPTLECLISLTGVTKQGPSFHTVSLTASPVPICDTSWGSLTTDRSFCGGDKVLKLRARKGEGSRLKAGVAIRDWRLSSRGWEAKRSKLQSDEQSGLFSLLLWVIARPVKPFPWGSLLGDDMVKSVCNRPITDCTVNLWGSLLQAHLLTKKKKKAWINCLMTVDQFKLTT